MHRAMNYFINRIGNLVFCRPLPRPPRKSMGWEIHGKSLENPWTNPGFLETQISAKSQGLKTSWPFFVLWENLYNVQALTFRCGSRRGSPGIDFSKGSGDLDLRQYWENNKRNIEKITNTNNVSDVSWDQMSPKKWRIHTRIIPHPSHLPESHSY